ncbi:hypothetical protein SUGI_1134570 [Cryptomeria japonica]|nr:hypothetical protein SUGI_1134570 [Cryptomeria japonica]
MGTAILPAQDYLVSYKTNQNRHSAGRVFHQSNLLQSGHEAVRANRSLRGRSPDFERRRTDPQVLPRFQEFERRWNPQSDLAFAASEVVSSGNLPNGAWQSQNFRSAERILRPMSTPPELHVGGSAPYGNSLSIFYAQQSYLQQSLSSRQYFQDANYSVANHETKGRRFSHQGKHIVMEKVTILKRGETLKAKETDKKSQIREKLPIIENNAEARLSNPKKNKSVWASRTVSNAPGDVTKKTNQVARPAKPKVMDNSVIITSTERLGPDPSVLPKEGSGILQSIAAAMKSTDIISGNGNPETLKDSAMSDGMDPLQAESPPSGSDYLSGSSPVFEMEKWAGPAYSNSPPPSSLPFPKFSMQQMRSIATDLMDASEGAKNVDQGLETQKKVQSSNGSSIQFGFDVSATQDLRRLLGLN